MYWLLGRNSSHSVYNKLLLYNQVVKPVWMYGIQLWGCARKNNLDIIQRLLTHLGTLETVTSIETWVWTLSARPSIFARRHERLLQHLQMGSATTVLHPCAPDVAEEAFPDGLTLMIE